MAQVAAIKRRGRPKKEIPPLKNRKITRLRMIKAIRGSGGLRRVIAHRLGCCYATVTKALEREGWDDVRDAYEIERQSVGDIAEKTVQDSMKQRLDMSVASVTARWYLERRHPERGFRENKQVTIEGGSTPLHIKNEVVLPLDELNLSLDVRKQILKAIEEKEKEKEEEEE